VSLGPLVPAGLRCAHKDAPLAVEAERVRFSWHLLGDGVGRRQTAYQVRVGRAEEVPAGPLPAEVRNVLSGAGLTGAEPAGAGASRQRWESLAAVAQLADDLYAAHPDAALEDFVAELQGRAALGHAPVMDGVTLASMHASKGLEWDAVFLPGLAEGVMPIVYARTPAAIDEERRLLYVAVTRARERLYLSWPAARGPGARAAGQPSRYLAELIPGPRPAPI